MEILLLVSFSGQDWSLSSCEDNAGARKKNQVKSMLCEKYVCVIVKSMRKKTEQNKCVLHQQLKKGRIIMFDWV